MQHLLTVSKKVKYFIYQLSLIFSIMIGGYYFHLTYTTQTDILYFLTFLTLVVIGVLKGRIVSLGINLLIIFFIGSYKFWEAWVLDPQDSLERLTVTFGWLLLFLIGSAVSGMSHQIITFIFKENEKLHQKYNDLVMVDLDTGLDNRKRFELILEKEFKRSARYHYDLNLLLIKTNHFDDFETLYGQKETRHFTLEISKKLNKNTRISDFRFRVQKDIFAILLTNTPREHVDVVIHKLEQQLTSHTLLNSKKEVTTSYSFGVSHYQKEMKGFRDMYENAKQDLETYIY
ncbi:GGDEF domain-containing protein [Bacillus shivajii]|uniref:diguanylate cyclase domain-containing protein n=1 Tax=Bacillus shivajii TaxID=1983719 RepID=UPI001CFB0303|nr:diguanylate cyclase [Bacillus shivajii]UCZ53582.1 GGDEF domain-containing protein [Bacillus shivajii]